MKKYFFGLMIVLSCILAACSKSKDVVCNYNDSSVVAPANEIDSVKSYLATNNITAIQHPNGFFYKINSQGNGQAIVNLCSSVEVKYTGRLTNGSVFDSTGAGTATFQLGRLIVGWQKGLPLISKGGKITLYIPPTLGYGNTDVKDAGVVIIPKNSLLIFDIELVDIK